MRYVQLDLPHQSPKLKDGAAVCVDKTKCPSGLWKGQNPWGAAEEMPLAPQKTVYSLFHLLREHFVGATHPHKVSHALSHPHLFPITSFDT